MNSFLLRSTALVALITSASVVQAQDAPAAAQATPGSAEEQDANSGDGQIGDIIVTAQRRSESLQKASVSVTAVTAEVLDQRRITDAHDLERAAPDVKVARGVGPTAEGFAIRGVGTLNFGGIPQAAPTVLDEVFVPSWIAFKTLFDVENVQILKGPQGTLFGGDSSSGLINIVTKKPQLGKVAAKLGISHQQADSQTKFRTTSLNGVLNLPFGSDAALRLTGYYSHRGNLFYSPILGREIHDSTESGFRAKFLWEPSDDLSIELTGAILRQNTPYSVTPIVTPAPGGFFEGLFNQYNVTPGRTNDTVFVDDEGAGIYKDEYLIGRVTYDFNGYSVTSISNYTRNRLSGAAEADSGPLNLLVSRVGVGDYNDGEGWGQEFKITSPSGERLTWVGGLQYSSGTGKSRGALTGFVFPFCQNDFGTALFPIWVSIGLCSPNGAHDYRYFIDIKSESLGAYGQGTYELVDNFRVLAGARVARQKQTFDYSAGGAPGESLAFIGFPSLASYKRSFSNVGFAWKLGAEYDLNPSAMVYANAAKGYKGAGWSILSIQAGDEVYVAPEIPMSYEVGFKSYLFDRKLRLNAAVFVTNYKDFQAQVFEQTQFFSRFLTQNAGKLETWGGEVEFEAKPARDLTVSGSAAYVRAKFADFDSLSCYFGQTAAQGCVGGIASADGNDLPNSPRWTWTLAANYAPQISSSLDGFVNANYYWRSKANFSALEDPATEVEAYGILGASAGIQDRDGRFKVTLFAKNLLNKHFPGSLGRVGGLYGLYSLAPPISTVEQPGITQQRNPDSYRQIGVALDFAF